MSLKKKKKKKTYEATSVCGTVGNQSIHHTKLMNSTFHKYNIFSSAQRAGPTSFHWVAWLSLQLLFVNEIYFQFLLMYMCLCKCMHCVQVPAKARRVSRSPGAGVKGVSRLKKVLGTDNGSSGKARGALNAKLLQTVCLLLC